MSKIEIHERIRQAVLHKGKPPANIQPSINMQIFIQPMPTVEPYFYTKVPWYQNVDVVCIDEPSANELKNFLLSDPSAQG